MKAFLSYSNKDKRLAGRIKRELETYGIAVFLAHDDVKPSAVWVERIIKELKTCNVFLPLLTKNFNKSVWTGQEAGIAFALKKPIISLKINKLDPQGFISRFQALKMNSNDLKRSCKRLIQTIADNPKAGELLRDALIQKFAGSESYIDANENAQFIVSLEGYNIKQVRTILKVAIQNDQIYTPFTARRVLKSFVSGYKHKSLIGAKLLQRFKKVFS